MSDLVVKSSCAYGLDTDNVGRQLEYIIHKKIINSQNYHCCFPRYSEVK